MRSPLVYIFLVAIAVWTLSSILLEKLLRSKAYKNRKQTAHTFRVSEIWPAFCLLIVVAIITQTMNTSLIIAFILIFLWAAEKFLKYNSAKKNMSTVRRDLPLLLDFLVLQVESGHSIQQALNYASLLFPEHSPVNLSLNKFQENIRLGSSIQAALEELAEFLDTTNSRTAFHTISQAIKHGTPLGGVLRNQANRMREQLVIEGEKFAQTISIKLLIPLLFFIFPASFLVIFSPVIVSITRIPR